MACNSYMFYCYFCIIVFSFQTWVYQNPNKFFVRGWSCQFANTHPIYADHSHFMVFIASPSPLQQSFSHVSQPREVAVVFRSASSHPLSTQASTQFVHTLTILQLCIIDSAANIFADVLEFTLCLSMNSSSFMLVSFEFRTLCWIEFSSFFLNLFFP